MVLIFFSFFQEHERRDAAASTTISFSSLLTEARAPRVILKERETHVKRNLQGDFIKAMQNESVEKDETEVCRLVVPSFDFTSSFANDVTKLC